MRILSELLELKVKRLEKIANDFNYCKSSLIFEIIGFRNEA